MEVYDMKFRLGQIFIFAAVLMIASVGMVGCDTEEIQYEEAESRIQYWLPLNATVQVCRNGGPGIYDERC